MSSGYARYSDEDVAALVAEAHTEAGHARDMENYLAGALLERPNFDGTRLLGRIADVIDRLADALSTLTTPKAWTPIGWNGPFRAERLVVYDRTNKFVGRTDTIKAATEIASALNTACQAGAVSEWRPTLQAALDRIDVADKECPVRQSKRSVEKCPKCSATVSDGCGLNVRALYSLETDIRSLLSPPKQVGANV